MFMIFKNLSKCWEGELAKQCLNTLSSLQLSSHVGQTNLILHRQTIICQQTDSEYYMSTDREAQTLYAYKPYSLVFWNAFLSQSIFQGFRVFKCLVSMGQNGRTGNLHPLKGGYCKIFFFLHRDVLEEKMPDFISHGGGPEEKIPDFDPKKKCLILRPKN